MRWQKTVTDKHVYDWQFFSLEIGSIFRLLVTGFICGLIYAAFLVKLWPGLPGEEMRSVDKKWKKAVEQATRTKAEMCKQFPTSKACTRE